MVSLMSLYGRLNAGIESARAVFALSEYQLRRSAIARPKEYACAVWVDTTVFRQELARKGDDISAWAVVDPKKFRFTGAYDNAKRLPEYLTLLVRKPL